MKKALFITSLICFTICAYAQKMPDVQTTSLVAPANIRIDGKSTEWNDTYVAENKRTEVFYSVANDDKNFYLVLKSANSSSANKIMMGGITFTINTQGKKRDKDAIAITYPLVVRANRNQGGRNGGGQGRANGGGQGGGFQNRQQQSQEQRDSAALVMRKTALATVKEIKISGIKSITDSLISIYNEYGLKAVASFDQKGAFVYELAIPLSLLELSPSDNKEFVYQIKLNGMGNMGFGGNGGGAFAGGGRPNGGGFGGGGNSGGGNSNSSQDMTIPTDFWGKYTLIKK